jgi:DNA-binding GntR family transcriptional regulator
VTGSIPAGRRCDRGSIPGGGYAVRVSGLQRPPARPLQARSLTAELAFRIQEDILHGVLRPGERLYQEHLSARYGVSRTPLREAIQRLEAQGLVRKLPNRAVVVRRLTPGELGEIYAVRAELEGYAAARAAAHHDDATMVRLQGHQAALTAAVEDVARSPAPAGAAALNERIAAANTDFHRTIRAAAGNAYLAEIITATENAFPKDYVWRALRTPEARRVLNIDEHEAIRRALERRDAAAAREAMRSHVLHAWALLRDYLAELGYWEDDLAPTPSGPDGDRAAAVAASRPSSSRSRARSAAPGSS